jgi:hypothetical protein
MQNQGFLNRRYSAASLRQHSTPRTLRLVAGDRDRADRIVALKAEHPRLTWAKIAQHVGVTERAAVAWAKTGALKPENAELLAEILGVDFDYIWTGPRPGAAEPFMERRTSRTTDTIAERLDRLEDLVATLIERQDRLLDAIREEADSRRALLQATERVLPALRGAVRTPGRESEGQTK